MKQPLSRLRFSRLSGFTLIELLVVIGIIAILASTILYAGGTAIRAAKRAQAANTMTQIQTAALGYYTEYGLYPVPTVATPIDVLIGDSSATDGSSWASLLYCLSGNISPSTGLTTPTPSTLIANSRGVSFLALKSSDVYTATDVTANANVVQDAPKNPLPTSTTAALFFNIAIDGDYDGILGTKSPTLGKMPNFSTSTVGNITTTGTSTAGVAVWVNCNGTATTTNPNFYVHTY